MHKAKNWFNGLTTGGQVGAIVGLFVATIFTVGVVGAAVSPTQPKPAPVQQTQSTQPAPKNEPVTTTKRVEEKSAVAFKTTYKDDNLADKGTTEVEQAGKNGERTITYEVTYVDGTETGRKKISDEVTTQPVDEVVLRGTYVAPTVETTPAAPAMDDSGGGGATAKCNDGSLSYSAHRQGTCSHHGGVAIWY